jgi:hypothetical protein
MFDKFLPVLALVLVASPASAAAQLVGDAISDGKRLCLYRGLRQDRIVTLPSSERCPSSLSDVVPGDKLPRIPSSATLEREEKTPQGKKACIYATPTKKYVRWVSRYSHCPLTR